MEHRCLEFIVADTAYPDRSEDIPANDYALPSKSRNTGRSSCHGVTVLSTVHRTTQRRSDPLPCKDVPVLSSPMRSKMEKQGTGSEAVLLRVDEIGQEPEAWERWVETGTALVVTRPVKGGILTCWWLSARLARIHSGS